MALVLSEEQVMLRDSAAGFLSEKAGVAQLHELRDAGSETAFDAGVWKEMAEMGWAGIAIAEEFGGHVHVFSPAYKPDEMTELVKIADPVRSFDPVAMDAAIDELSDRVLELVAKRRVEPTDDGVVRLTAKDRGRTASFGRGVAYESLELRLADGLATASPMPLHRLRVPGCHVEDPEILAILEA